LEIYASICGWLIILVIGLASGIASMAAAQADQQRGLAFRLGAGPPAVTLGGNAVDDMEEVAAGFRDVPEFP